MKPAVAQRQRSTTIRTIGLTTIAMIAFAGNSLLCRLALAQQSIDPATFTLIRIGSGVAALALMLSISGQRRPTKPSWPSALALFGYAAAFSFAYLSLSAGTGALLLFGAVQATMVATGLSRGERMAIRQWTGFVMALAGLAALLAPGVSAPSFSGAALMLVAGVAWGAYSLLGRGKADPVNVTASNFLLALPMAGAIWMAFWIGNPGEVQISGQGIFYAIMSGALASGAGYAIWYAALPGLTATQGASVQLSVPVITALGGALVLGETVTLRLVASSLAVLGGITLVIANRRTSA